MIRATAILVAATLLAPIAPAAAQCGPSGRVSRIRPRPVADSLLVGADWLAAHRTDSTIVVIHATRSAAAFDSAHVPGSRLVLTAEFAGERDGRETEIPPARDLERLLTRKGVTATNRIIVTGDLLAATRLWFTLDYFGLGGRAAILDGGVDAWRAIGQPVGTGPAPADLPAGRLALDPDPSRLATADWIRARLDDPEVAIVDVRTPDEYAGLVEEKNVPRRGHIPGALNLEWTRTLEDGVFKAPKTLRAMLEAAGSAPGAEIVSVCRVGSRASLLYFIGRYLGLPARLYDGSMAEWSAAGLPLVTGGQPR